MTDLLWGKVFNGITFSFLAVGLIYQFWRAGLPAGGSAFLAVLLAFVLFFPLWRLRIFAAGDVKLLMAVGAWTDWRLVLQLAMIAIVVGATVGGFVLAKRNGGLHGALSQLTLKTTRMPFAPAFLCAFFLVKIAEMRGWSLLWF